MVRDGAMHGEALVETKREGHGSLAGRRIVGGMRTKAQGPSGGEMIVLLGEYTLLVSNQLPPESYELTIK